MVFLDRIALDGTENIKGVITHVGEANFYRGFSDTLRGSCNFNGKHFDVSIKKTKEELKYRTKFLRTVNDFLRENGVFLIDVNFEHNDSFFNRYPAISGSLYTEGKPTTNEASRQ